MAQVYQVTHLTHYRLLRHVITTFFRYAVPSTTPIVVEAATGTVNPPFAVDRQRTERSLNLLQQVGLTPTGFTVDALVGENNSVVNFY